MKILNKKNIIWNFCKNFANLNFSIFLLFLISCCIMLGSIIEQNQNLSYYKIYYATNHDKLFFINWKLIFILGLDHIYENWWFFIIIFIFACSLTICTFSTQLPSLKNARRWKFFDPSNKLYLEKKVVDSVHNPKNSITNIIYSLLVYNFFIFHKKNSVYAYKGIIGRISPIFVHFSIIVILLGSTYSVLFNLVIQEMIPSGEIFHLKNIVSAGFYSSFNKLLVGKIDNFLIDYNSDKSIKQFISHLSLFDSNNNLLITKQISVNSPLKFFNLTFYQTDWNINSIRLNIGTSKNLVLQKKIFKTTINNKSCWICSLPINEYKQIYIVIFDLNKQFLITDSSGLILAYTQLNQPFYLNNTSIYIKSIILDTGIQIKLDPGVSIIYLGFLILMLTTLVSYISYSQIWISCISNTLNVAGTTNRATLAFNKDIIDINKIYYQYTFKLSIIEEPNLRFFTIL